LPARLAATTVTDRLRVRSEPGVGDDSVRYEPPLPRGTEFRIVEGPVYASDYWWYRVAGISARLDGGVDAGWVASADHDGTPWIGPVRDACLDFEFRSTATTVETFDELESALIGTWAGCVWTPWTPPYWVTLEFRADGTYTSRAEVAPNGEKYPALYYGTDDDSPDKRYQLHDLHDSGLGSGQIDIGGNRDELRNIALMGDRMQFEFFHASVYGPLTYRLYLQGR